MMRSFLFAAAALAIGIMPLAAQTISFNTGDASLDITLSSLDQQARADGGAFASELSVTYAVEQPQIQNWITVERLRPAEVYLLLELGRISKKPPATVIQVYRRYGGRGWGVVARALGIRPGSAAFRALKRDAANRDRWAMNRRMR